MFFSNPFTGLRRQISQLQKQVASLTRTLEQSRQAIGRVEARQCAASPESSLTAHEFQVSSQWGEDGIFEFLFRQVTVPNRVFIEFGVQNYTESNTRFLLTQRGWSGLVIDGSEGDIAYIRRDPIYWRYNLKTVCAFITRDNINDLIRAAGLGGEIGLLSVDIDGNDYWVWEAITEVRPAVVVAEYNSLFGPDRAVTVPYDSAFVRTTKHHSNLYYGASLAALVGLGRRKGYAFIGTNSAGNNAFFVRRDLLPASLREITAAAGFTARKFREGRDAAGELTFLGTAEEAAIANALPLVEVEP